MVKRSTRRLPAHGGQRRTLRGGGTASYGFISPPDFARTVNNGFVTSAGGCGAPSHATAPLGGGGMPGLSTGAGVSLQKGGGGTHYGFNGGGLAGGNSAIATNCALPQSGGSGQLNVPQGAMAGGRRRKQKNTRKNKSRRNKQSRRR